MNDPYTLNGKRILITGASSGIGRSCAIILTRLGAQVAISGRSNARLQETLDLLSGQGHVMIPYDCMDLDNIEALVRTAAEPGLLNGLVHAAGVCSAVPIQAQSVEDMQSAMTVNYFFFIALMKQFVKKKYCQGGSVVAISSVSAEAGWPGGAVYSGTKGALSASVRSIALELAPRRIRVNAVEPSNIQTPMFDAIAGDMHDGEGMRQLLAKQPLGLGQPEDVAHAVAFLLSDAARFITGAHLAVDGGYLAQ